MSVDRVRERVERARVQASGSGRGGGGGGGFDLGRLELGERVAGVSGLLLVILMFFGWFVSGSAWETLSRLDLVLLLVALIAIGIPLAYALDRGPARPEAASLALTVAGGIAFGIMLALVLESTGGTFPLVLSLLATGAILLGGATGLTGGASGPSPASDRRSVDPYDRRPPAA